MPNHPWRQGRPFSKDAGRYTGRNPHPEKITLFRGKSDKWTATFQGQVARVKARREYDARYDREIDLGKFDAYEILTDAFPEFRGIPYVVVPAS